MSARKTSGLASLLALGLLALPLRAQEDPGAYPPGSTLVERVAAVVGDSVILLTQVQQELRQAQARGVATTAAEVLESLIDNQLVLQAAARDTTLAVDEQRVEQALAAELERIKGLFPTDQAFEQALAAEGLTPAAHRQNLRSLIHSSLLRDAYLTKRLRSVAPVAVSEEELRAVFEERRGELGDRPERMTVRGVLIESGPSDSAWARAGRSADSLYGRVLAGEEFEALARERSEDPGSAQEGGDLGWIRRGQLVPPVEQAIFAMQDGTVSPPVRSEFGYHVIKVERSRPPGEKRVRHILVRPETGAEDRDATRALAEDVARRLRAGEDPDSLASAYGDPDLASEFLITSENPGGAPPEFVQQLAGAAQGDVVGPFETQVRGTPYQVVLLVTDVREAGAYTFEDLRAGIRQRLVEQKQLERIIESLRERTYVDVRN